MSFDQIVGELNSFAWGPIMLVLLVGTGIMFTIGTKFFQFSKFGYVIKNTLGKLFTRQKTDDKGAITPFQALATAMAATVGTGNIAGVATAILLGGPGAIFWMWISALFGMMTKYAEVVLAVKFRERNAKGDYVGGPMYYIKNGLGKNWTWLGSLFCIFGALAAFGIGNMTQINTVIGSMTNAVKAIAPNSGVDSIAFYVGEFGISMFALITGIIIAVLIAIVVFGGIKRIGAVTGRVVPFMSVFYILGGLIIIIINIGSIGTVLGSIFSAAFSDFNTVIGGVVGFTVINAMRRGVSRGVFSNEAGLGSSPIAHATSSETNPVRQGLYGVFEVFMDTIVLCTMTALVILMSGVITPADWGNSAIGGATLTGTAYATIFGQEFASIFIAIAILFFAGSTILSWQLYGQRCFEFLFKGKGVKIYQFIFIIVIVIGATIPLSIIWDIADTLNGFMAIPNLIALIALSGVVFKATKEYQDSVITPEKLARREKKLKARA